MACSRQTSISSCADDAVLPPLPPEVGTKILHYLSTRELVRTCMLVSKSWYFFLTDPMFWISKIKKWGNFNPMLTNIDTVQWPQLCFHAVEETNLIKSFNFEGKLCLDPYWRMSSTRWDIFKLVEKRDQIRWNRGGGSMWAIEENDWIHLDKPEDEAVLKANGGSRENYVTSYSWCCREQIVQLSTKGLSDVIMDSVQPAIAVSEWFYARFDCASRYFIRVDLLSSDHKVIACFEDSEETAQWQGGELGWRVKSHVFREYGEGVRYIRFADAGIDSQFWLGHYGSKMAAASAAIIFKET